MVTDGGAGVCGRHVLLASKIILGALGLVVEVASVLDGDSIPLLRLIGAVALGDDLPSDTHYASGAGECCWEACGCNSGGEVRVQSVGS